VITTPGLFCTAGMLIFLYKPVQAEIGTEMKTLLMLAETGD
jgi:hypothetical protein